MLQCLEKEVSWLKENDIVSFNREA